MKIKKVIRILGITAVTAAVLSLGAVAIAASVENPTYVMAEEMDDDEVIEIGGGETEYIAMPQPMMLSSNDGSVSENDSDKKPNVAISISTPDGWYTDSATVSFAVEDLLNTGNFKIASVKAKAGQSGAWTDVTEEMAFDISENCSVYVQVTDQNGTTYTKNKSVKCFDKTKPTLNCAVNNGLLTVDTYDSQSGVKTIYINNHEYNEFTNGTLNIRLKKFDKGYEYFSVKCMDNVGNMSDTYKVKNPYYEDEDSKKNNNGSNSSVQLPVSVAATNPTSATANVTDHIATDTAGGTTVYSSSSQEAQKHMEMEKADASEKEYADSGIGINNSEPESGADFVQPAKEFYTIQTASEKVFYLVIDRTGDEEKVYFLTEISENDLLNVTSDNSQEIPMNSAALESAIPTSEEVKEDTEEEESEITVEEPETEEEADTEEPEENNGGAGAYVIMGILAAGAIGAGYYLKMVKKKNEEFLDEEDDETDPDEEIYEREDSEDEYFVEECEKADDSEKNHEEPEDEVNEGKYESEAEADEESDE